jgi:NAD(P)-dependent dehydrogenase (short-subunit alcohol dehydrogenase family)
VGRLDGKVAIVTGAASGIGATVVQVLAQHGAAVVAADIDATGARARARAINAAGHRAMAVEVDITNEAQVQSMIATTLDAFGGLHILHANAAATLVARDNDPPVHEADAAIWTQTMSINVIGTMLCCKHAIAPLLAGGGGSIIITSSGAGLQGDLGHPAYGCSKAAIASLARYIAVQYGKQGLRCNAISPGLIETEASEPYLQGPVRSIMTDAHLTPRMGTPNDIANLVVYLASDESQFVTGQNISIDGGIGSQVASVPAFRLLGPS